jgi:hypothetical protein
VEMRVQENQQAHPQVPNHIDEVDKSDYDKEGDL